LTVGKWSLGEMCDHLANTMNRALDGYPKPMPWVVRRTIGPYILKKILKEGRMATGIQVPKILEPKSGTDATVGAETLRAAIERLQKASDPFPENAFFGRITKDETVRLQTIHCAHHLSFAVPTGESTTA